jgi:aspartyl-tRNA(Asn)/glutamyl-tRNA(Gln) amidotransferase subunit A
VTDPWRLSARELLAAYRARELSPLEALDALAARIEAVEPALNAFTTLALDEARAEAARATEAYARGEPQGPLAGVPLAVKDLFDTAGVRTTYGSPLFRDHVPAADAEPVRRAKAAGAIMVGKTSTHEFAWGITSENPHFGASRNPWAPERVSGGSSGGSGVALAAQEVPLALGSDTGGSIRVPSAFCGVVGLKPTFGRVSAAGVFPLARSLDHPGPMARTPADAALLLGAIAGVDPADPATEDEPLGDLEAGLGGGLAGLRVGVCSDLHRVPLAADVEAVWESTLDVVQGLGAELVEVDLPEAERVYETFVSIQRAEALFTHEQRGLYPARREAYGADVLGRLEAATAVTVSEYLAAAAERQRIRAGFARLLREVDLLLTPVSAGSPLPIGERKVEHLGREIDFRELVMSYTVPQDLTGLPACALRAGFDDLGIPVGVQLTGRPWTEALVLRGTQALFEATAELQARWPAL